jgi:predicted small lipoprotein YifL
MFKIPMKISLLKLIVFLAVAVSLVGCGSNAPDISSTTPLKKTTRPGAIPTSPR